MERGREREREIWGKERKKRGEREKEKKREGGLGFMQTTSHTRPDHSSRKASTEEHQHQPSQRHSCSTIHTVQPDILLIVRQRETLTDQKRDRQTDQQTDRQTDNRSIERQTDRQTTGR